MDSILDDEIYKVKHLTDQQLVAVLSTRVKYPSEVFESVKSEIQRRGLNESELKIKSTDSLINNHWVEGWKLFWERHFLKVIVLFIFCLGFNIYSPLVVGYSIYHALNKPYSKLQE